MLTFENSPCNSLSAHVIVRPDRGDYAYFLDGLEISAHEWATIHEQAMLRGYRREWGHAEG